MLFLLKLKTILTINNKLPVSEFNEFKPRFKLFQNRFQLSAGLNL